PSSFWLLPESRNRESIATLDSRLVRSPFFSNEKEANGAGRKSVHAEDQRSFTTQVRAGVCQPADCTQLLDQPQYGRRLRVPCQSGRAGSMALARRLGRSGPGKAVVSNGGAAAGTTASDSELA